VDVLALRASEDSGKVLAENPKKLSTGKVTFLYIRGNRLKENAFIG